MDMLEKISKLRIVPTIVIDDEDKALPLGQALLEGGIPCAEITFRTSKSEKSLHKLAKSNLKILLGAGTVLTCDQVDKALEAGAKYIVTPGLNPKVVEYCLKKNVPIIPGCITPGEMEVAIEYGLNTIKFFPAEAAGGLEYLKAVSAPYSMIKFLPTGGIGLKNFTDYLLFNKVIACGGSWMAGANLIKSGDFNTIVKLCKETVKLLSLNKASA